MERFSQFAVAAAVEAMEDAGIDMEKFDPQSVRISENKRKGTKKISLELPQPKIFTYNVRPEDVKLLYSEVSLLRTEYTNKERDEIVAKGLWELKTDKELTAMILRDARLNAESFVEMLLRRNGFTNVEITFKEED